MSDKIFVDTNVLVYAHDRDAGEKRTVARARVEALWETRRGMLSTQVLQELYVTITRKIPKPVSRTSARDLVRNYTVWQVELPSPELVLVASEIEERYQLSFWDGLILAAARQGGAGRVLSEDLPAGQTIAGLTIENPFAQAKRR